MSESEGLLILAVTPGPRLAHVNDDHVVVSDHIQQFALIVGRESLSETFPKRVHKTLQPGQRLRIVLNVIRPQKPWQRRCYRFMRYSR